MYRRRSLLQAEKAATEGQGGEEFDTQACENLQEHILSVLSSPRESQNDEVASNLHPEHGSNPSNLSVVQNFDNPREDTIPANDPERLPVEASGRVEEQSSGLEVVPAHDNDAPTLLKQALPKVRRHSTGKLPQPDHEGNPIRLVLEKSAEKFARMEDLTQTSSPMSPTQQNSDSAYAHIALDPQQQLLLRAKYPTNKSSIVEEEAQTTRTIGQDSLLAKHSVITDSTAYTYGEDDTGHVNFDGLMTTGSLQDITEKSQEFEDMASQDASFAPQVQRPPYERSYEPQTPAPPINPFSQKGSVLKGHEMFGATQPSSIGRHMASATSSRPSPNIYDDFTSPVKRMQSSPLPGHFQGETSPLQSSVRTLLRSRATESPVQAHLPRASSVQSFNSGPRNQPQSAPIEPRKYKSLQQSQEERRLKEASHDSPSDTDSGMESDDLAKKHSRKKRREREVRRQLAGVEVRARLVSSSKPNSSAGVVEVPSTGRRGRRRSTQEDYVAQCEGHDARDTQQDDVIADSQAIARETEESEAADSSKPFPDSAEVEKSNTPPLPRLPTQLNVERSLLPELDAISNSDETSSTPQDPSSPFQPSLPLKDVSTNLNEFRTPMTNKTQACSDAAYTTVPETSPPENAIRPMKDVANISFQKEAQETLDVQGLGFSQDVDFENAINPHESPGPTPRKPRASRTALNNATASLQTSNNLNALIATLQPVAPTIPGESAMQPNVIEPAATSPKTNAQVVPFQPENTVEDNDAMADDEQENINPEMTIGQTSTDAGEVDHESPMKKGGLRSKDELKGPSRALRRSGDNKAPKTYATPRQSTRTTKPSSAKRSSSAGKPSTGRSSKRTSTQMSSPMSSLTPLPSSPPVRSVTRSSAKKAAIAPTRSETPIPVPMTLSSTRRSVGQKADASTPALLPKNKLAKTDVSTSASLHTKKSPKRKSAVTIAYEDEPTPPTRSSKRRSTATPRIDNTPDPLIGPIKPTQPTSRSKPTTLFANMAFAVSYIKREQEKAVATRLINEYGGKILNDGFEALFEPGPASKPRAQSEASDSDLALSPFAKGFSFTALIADEHSRKAKYMQALALGLPCLSGRWISACVDRGKIVDWLPYLLCAGQSSFLGNAFRSRTLLPYPAADASFPETFASREKILNGKSILVVDGKGQAAKEKRKAYVFLTRALGPARLEQVSDFEHARRKLLDAEGGEFDLLYVDTNEKGAESTVFGSTLFSSGGSKKRKRGPTAVDEAPTPAPKKIRIISDEVVIQSLILGQLLEE